VKTGAWSGIPAARRIVWICGILSFLADKAGATRNDRALTIADGSGDCRVDLATSARDAPSTQPLPDERKLNEEVVVAS
jgi:hypothetical protein